MPAAVLSALSLLAACGGGDDGASETPARTPPADTAPAPAPSPTPTPAPDPDPDPAPAPIGELLPSLSAPQPGSTALVGNGSEGIWSSFGNATLVDGSGKFVSTALLSVLGGTFQFSGSTWTLGSDTVVENGFVNLATGSGTITPANRLDGSYTTTPGGVSKTLAAIYDPANALAVEQSSISGSWKQNAFAMQIDDTGNLTGTYTSGTRVCDLKGTVVLATPASAKNLYVVDVEPSVSPQPGNTGCALSTGVPHKGYAAIRFAPVDGAIVVNSNTRYLRTLLMVARTGTGGYFMTQMSRQ
ncbi:hypothetical protein D2917_02370 [Cupriavidus oxalaticus]|uniref:Uncharacterized protein n=2 Tax=Cupriavidus oxalaticus TaxID=96344 RepID=A0A5P3VE48_9BURK|nr:hypothetical protein D2917_02370 [Cupriavidus oxalaticus]